MANKDEDEEKKALAKKKEGTLAPTDLSTEEMLALAERRMELLDKVLALAISSTNPRDWVNQEGEPYLMATGAEKIARRFGLKIVGLIKEPKEIIDDKGNYKYTLMAEFKLPTDTDSIMAIGSCTSRDKFFSRAKGRTRTLEEINPHDIEMKAYSNMLNNGVKRLLGLRNLSWKQLKAAGLAIDKIVGVQYANSDKDKKEAGKPQEKPVIKNPDAPASDAQLKTIDEHILKSHLMHPAEKFALADQLKKGVNKKIASDIIGFWIGEDKQNKMSGERGRRNALERKGKEVLASYLKTQEAVIEKKKPDIYKAYKEANNG